MLTVEFIKVGYGDAVLIQRTQAREEPFRMLVDCGDSTLGDYYPRSQRISAGHYLQKHGIDTLDLLVLTHLHLDHCGGLRQLPEGLKIKELWVNYLPDRSLWNRELAIPEDFSDGAKCLLYSRNTLLKALTALEAQGTCIRPVIRKQFVAHLDGGLRLDVFSEDLAVHQRQHEIWTTQFLSGPDNATLVELDRFINNTSIRMRVTYGEVSIELPGDVCAECWEKHEIKPCQIVKLPHHGHKDSASARLFSMMQPQYTVVSVSNSRTDHCPSESVINLAQKYKSRLLFTDAVKARNLSAHFHEALRFSIPPHGPAEFSYVEQDVLAR